MCGRYCLSNAERFAELNDVRLGGKFLPRFNIAPTQRVPVVLDESPDTLSEARWGLIPFWAKDMKMGATLINARSETAAKKPAFRSAWKKRRCLIPSDGFYEWQKAGTLRIPHHILMNDGEPFAFAGLWEVWRDRAVPDSEPVRTCTIITCAANVLVAPIHDRMPVIIPRARYSEWLSADTSPEERAAMLTPYRPWKMRAYPISERVNFTRNDDPSIIEPLQ